MKRLLLSESWLAGPLFWVELFALFNIAFLAFDILVAHGANNYEHPAEWIPIAFSMGATLVLFLGMVVGRSFFQTVSPPPSTSESDSESGWDRAINRWLGLLVGAGSVVVGVAGLLWHLNSDFFQDQSLRNLVYTAPFVAPLAYTGVGLLLILNRMENIRGSDWPRWLLLLAAGGFAGNFVLSLADHAQNGFFYPSEWIGVVGGAIAFGFLLAGVIVPESLFLCALNAWLMLVQIVIGVLGFALHAWGSFVHAPGTLWERLVYGPPLFAPLLFADLALLGLLGLWAQYRWLASLVHHGEPGITPTIQPDMT